MTLLLVSIGLMRGTTLWMSAPINCPALVAGGAGLTFPWLWSQIPLLGGSLLHFPSLLSILSVWEVLSFERFE